MTALLLSLMLTASVDVHYMPLGTDLALPSGEKVRYFNFDEYKQLLSLDGEVWDLKQKLEIYKDLDDKYAQILAQKDVIIQTVLSDKKIFEEQLKRTTKLWQDAERRTIEVSGNQTWSYVLAAGGVVIGIVGTTLYLSTLASR